MNLDISNIMTAIVTGSIVLVGRSLVAAIMTDVARRINLTIVGVRFFDRLTPKFFDDPVWEGNWKVSWEVESKNFRPRSSETVRIARCFNTIVLEGSGATVKGKKIPYGFVGKFSRDRSIVTGIWFDRRGGDGGYHGVYQLRRRGGADEAEGLWSGFSEENHAIKSGKLLWQKVHLPS